MKSVIALLLKQVKEQKISIETALTLINEIKKSPVQDNAVSLAGQDQDIAVIGLYCRFPGAEGIEQFWQNLESGRSCTGCFPEQRFTSDQRESSGPIYGGFINDIEQFATRYFNISAREAAFIDPYQRLFLETGLHTFHSAGYGAQRLWGSKTAVFVGARMSLYTTPGQDWTAHSRTAVTGNLANFIATRVSDYFNLSGPALAIDTACSSSLVALHYACHSLRQGECEMALAGGINIHITAQSILNLKQAGALSDGPCSYVFDRRANGFVPGEGVGAVLLKPLARARQDKDLIYAVIKGSAVVNDGHTMGITTPNHEGQKQALRQAYQQAGIDPATLTYIEAHGTGTTIGDPIELKALYEVFREFTDRRAFCAIGSVKTNIGHLDTASGIASLIKVSLALHHKKLPATLHCEEPNPRLNLVDSPFYPVTRAEAWQPARGVCRAGISSFGFGGTNCHVILEQAPQQVKSASPTAGRLPLLLTLSARSEAELTRLKQAYCQLFPDLDLQTAGQLCYTSNTGRDRLPVRFAVTADRADQLLAALKGKGSFYRGSMENKKPARVAFWYSSVLSAPALWYELLKDPGLVRCLDQVKKLLKSHFALSLESVLQSSDTEPHWALSPVVHFVMSRFWIERGVKPGLIIAPGSALLSGLVTAGLIPLSACLRIVQALANEEAFDPSQLDLAALAGKKLLYPVLIFQTSQIIKGRQFDGQELLSAAIQSGPALTAASIKLPAQITGLLDLGANREGSDSLAVQMARAKQLNYYPACPGKGESWQTIQQCLARLFTAGCAIDWLVHEQAFPRPKIRLPLYPLAREYCWNDSSTPARQEHSLLPEASASPLPNPAHPSSQQVTVTISRRQTPFIEDHQVMGQFMLPGVSYWELARTAFRQVFGKECPDLEEVTHNIPVILPDQQPLALTVRFQDKKFSITSQNQSGEQIVHAAGKINAKSIEESRPDSVPEIELKTLLHNCERIQESRAEIYARFTHNNVYYGPFFQSIDALYRNENTIIAHLIRPESRCNKPDFVQNHPGQLDGALQLIIALGREKAVNTNTYVPFFIESITYYETLPVSCFAVFSLDSQSHASKEPAVLIAGTISLYSESGACLMRIKGIRFKKVELAGAGAQKGRLYRPCWIKGEIKKQNQPPGPSFLLVYRLEQAAQARICQNLQANGFKLIQVLPGARQFDAEHLTAGIDFFQPADISWLLDQLQSRQIKVERVLYLAAFYRAGEQVVLPGPHLPLVWHCLALFQQIKGLAEQRKQPLALYAVTESCQPVLDGERPAALQGLTLTGLMRVIPQEYRTVSAAVIDCCQEELDQSLLEDYLQSPPLRPVSALRKGQWFYPVMQSLAPLPSDRRQKRVKAGGVYLISGGLGGIGFALCQYLAARFQARLVLISRRGLPEREKWPALNPNELEKKQWEQIKAIQALEKTGARIAVIKADVTSRADLIHVKEELQQRQWQLQGIFHTAGVIRDKLLCFKKAEDFEAVLAPKVLGTELLYELFNGPRLDFMVLFSSFVSLFGNPGQADYVAANNFLDGYAWARDKMIALNWTIWQEVGMGISSGTAAASEEQGLTPLSPEEGLKLLFQALASEERQVLIMNNDLKTFYEKHGIQDYTILAPKQLPLASSQQPSMQSQQQTRLQPETDEDPGQLAGLLQILLLEKAAALLQIDSNELIASEPFLQLGLDSVTLVEMSGWIGERLDISLYPTVLFEYPSIEQLSLYLAENFTSQVNNYFAQKQLSMSAVPQTGQSLPDFSVAKQAKGEADYFDEEALALAVEQILLEKAAQLLNVDTAHISAGEPFLQLGLDSVTLVELSGWIGERLDISLYPTVFFEYPSITQLALYLSQTYTRQCSHYFSQQTVTVVKPLSPLSIQADIDYPENIETALPGAQTGPEDIAVIAAAGRFPGASDVDEYWHNIINLKPGISTFPEQRIAPHKRADLTAGKAIKGGFLSDVDAFDPLLVNISPTEASYIDPQQRIFLETVWKLFESIGYSKKRRAGYTIGLFVGASQVEYRSVFPDNEALSPYMGLGSSLAVIANRVSYLFGLQGPSMTIDTACSSSLVSVHQACQSILQGESDLAVAGGVQLYFSPDTFEIFSIAGMLSRDGRCKTFDRSADGYVRGEGVGAVLLKKLSRAEQDRDRILAVIKASAVNHDGSNKVGITAPNPQGQQKVILQALAKSGLTASDMDYIEAHGTGTSLGDPIEINALNQAFRQSTGKSAYCAVGTVKALIGHLEAAAGIAGLIKVIKLLEQDTLPPMDHMTVPNPHINFANTPFYINDKKQAFPAHKKLHNAAVSAFGFGGTNCHVILQQYPGQPAAVEVKEEEQNRHCFLFPFSARTRSALERKIEQFQAWIIKEQPVRLEAAAFTAALGRDLYDYRCCLLAADQNQVCRQLEQIITNGLESLLQSDTGWYAEPCPGKKSLGLVVNNQQLRLVWQADLSRLSRLLPGFKESLKQVVQAWPGQIGEELLSMTGLAPERQSEESQEIILFAAAYAFFRLLSDLSGRQLQIFTENESYYAAQAAWQQLSLEQALAAVMAKQPGQTKAPDRAAPLIMAGLGPIGSAWQALKPGLIIACPPQAMDRDYFEKTMLSLAGYYFCLGGEINFEVLYQNRQLTMISIPLYPFDKRSYWCEWPQTDQQQPILTPTHEAAQKQKTLSNGARTDSSGPPVSSQKKKKQRQVFLDFLISLLQAAFKLDNDQVEIHMNFTDYGLDSIVMQSMLARIEAFVGQPVDTGLFIQYPTLAELARHLAAQYPLPREQEMHSPPHEGQGRDKSRPFEENRLHQNQLKPDFNDLKERRLKLLEAVYQGETTGEQAGRALFETLEKRNS